MQKLIAGRTYGQLVLVQSEGRTLFSPYPPLYMCWPCSCTSHIYMNNESHSIRNKGQQIKRTTLLFPLDSITFNNGWHIWRLASALAANVVEHRPGNTVSQASQNDFSYMLRRTFVLCFCMPALLQYVVIVPAPKWGWNFQGCPNPLYTGLNGSLSVISQAHQSWLEERLG